MRSLHLGNGLGTAVCLLSVLGGGYCLWAESDLQEAAPEIPCALGKTNSAALLSCTKLTALARSTWVNLEGGEGGS